MVWPKKSAWVTALILAYGLSAGSQASETEEERRAKQAELDAACEAARQEELAALRGKLIEECVQKKEWPREDRASCERYYADFGNTTPHQVGLFYDLPECVRAHDYRTSYRRAER
jgi:hypothetical protein